MTPQTNVTLTFKGTPTPSEIAEALRAQANALVADTSEDTDDEEETSETDIKTLKGKKHAASTDDDEETDEDTDATEDEDEEETSSKKSSSLDLEEDLVPALNKYAKKNSREKAIKVLKKFGVKSVRDLEESDYKAFMKALK